MIIVNALWGHWEEQHGFGQTWLLTRRANMLTNTLHYKRLHDNYISLRRTERINSFIRASRFDLIERIDRWSSTRGAISTDLLPVFRLRQTSRHAHWQQWPCRRRGRCPCGRRNRRKTQRRSARTLTGTRSVAIPTPDSTFRVPPDPEYPPEYAARNRPENYPQINDADQRRNCTRRRSFAAVYHCARRAMWSLVSDEGYCTTTSQLLRS